jgi:hypothetical protein
MFFIGLWTPVGYRDVMAMTHVDRMAWVLMCDHKRKMDAQHYDRMKKDVT